MKCLRLRDDLVKVTQIVSGRAGFGHLLWIPGSILFSYNSHHELLKEFGGYALILQGYVDGCA